jgi:hypothetical protein
MKELLKLANDDYQKRGGAYPKSYVPDSIEVNIGDTVTTIEFDFKNTNDSEALEWYEKSKESKVINKYKKDYDITVATSQDGTFEDDWQKLTVSLRKKDSMQQAAVSNEADTQKSDDIGFIYTYILSTPQQRELIDLAQYKTQLQHVITQFFEERLLSVEFQAHSYTLHLRDAYQVADKRRLGRLISENTDLKQYVRKILYNNSQDTSGQLFRLMKVADNG